MKAGPLHFTAVWTEASGRRLYCNAANCGACAEWAVCPSDIPGLAEIDLLPGGHESALYRCHRHPRAEVLNKILPRKLVETHAVRPGIFQGARIIPSMRI